MCHLYIRYFIPKYGGNQKLTSFPRGGALSEAGVMIFFWRMLTVEGATLETEAHLTSSCLCDLQPHLYLGDPNMRSGPEKASQFLTHSPMKRAVTDIDSSIITIFTIVGFVVMISLQLY